MRFDYAFIFLNLIMRLLFLIDYAFNFLNLTMQLFS